MSKVESKVCNDVQCDRNGRVVRFGVFLVVRSLTWIISNSREVGAVRILWFDKSIDKGLIDFGVPSGVIKERKRTLYST